MTLTFDLACHFYILLSMVDYAGYPSNSTHFNQYYNGDMGEFALRP